VNKIKGFTNSEVNKIKGFTNSECPNTGVTYFFSLVPTPHLIF